MFDKTQINNLDDVTEFFKYIYQERGVNFHPDDSFDRYINLETMKPTFTNAECKLYDRLMVECFHICEDLNADIYDHALTILPFFDR